MRRDRSPMAAAISKIAGPVLALCGIVMVALSQVAWGSSDEGIRPTITGLGRVSAPGVADEDLVFLAEHTQRPGLLTVLTGTLMVVMALIYWWRRRLFWFATPFIAMAAIATLVWGAVVLSDPGRRLYDAMVIEELGPDMPAVSAGYGLIGEVVAAVLALVVVAVVMVVDYRTVDFRTGVLKS